MDKWCVYMHENRLNGKRYIGITGQKPEKRWKNGLGYKGCPHFLAAIQKYGWDAFQHDILFTGLTQAEAERLEVEMIAKYQTQDPSNGYNLRDGGEAASCSAETRARMSAAARSREVSPSAWVAARKKQVICLETGKVYRSLLDAQKQTGVDRSVISRCCANKPHCNTAGGYHWQFVDI